MIKAVSLTTLAALVLAATAHAVTAPKGLTATAKGSKITIVNHSTKSIKGFFINSTDSPKITGASDKACKVATSKAYKSGGKTHHDYYADCNDALAAGKTRVITLTMSGSGTIFVWAKVGTLQVKIATGN